MKILFWLSVIIILYVYLGYPVLVYLLSLLYKKPVRGKYVFPKISILISVFNEEKNIENKIRSLSEINYPQERMEILIGSDGSADKTDEIIAKYIGGKVKLFRLQERQGKPSVLNLLASQANGEILVFTDARQRLDKNTLSELVKHFSDDKVGSVSSALFYENERSDNKTGAGIGLYWKYEKLIRKSESRMGSMLGATGALYAIREELYPELPKDLILDDVYIPMKIVEKGYRAIFDSKAKVFDQVFNDPKQEFARKTRTLAGNFQLFVHLRELFNPLRGKISWQFFSHKFLRLIVPFMLIVIFVTNGFMLESSFYKGIFIIQVIFYCLAFLGMIFNGKNRVIDVPYMFCVLNSAAIVGLYRFLTNKQGILWQRAGASL